MLTSVYLCLVVGEDVEKYQKFHPSSRKRLTAFALAIHIPVILWAFTGYVIANSIFQIGSATSLCIAFACSTTIYLVERIVLATPNNFMVHGLRVVIGLVIAVLGASTLDLVMFKREIAEQLQISYRERIQQDYEKKSAAIVESIEQKKSDWQRAQEAANCEANGTCGSRIRSVGPVYRELSRQSDILRNDYLRDQKNFELLTEKKNLRLDEVQEDLQKSTEAGLLSRIKALHDYTTSNPAAFVTWALFLCLVLFFELLVVISKLVFGETVDDELDRIRETISQDRARAYKEAITSPVFSAREMVKSALT